MPPKLGRGSVVNFWLLLRLAGIGAGIVTMLGLATGHLGITLQPVFSQTLEQLQQYVNVVLATPLIELLLKALRQLDLPVPEIGIHWQPIYTLSALLNLSLARNSSRNRLLLIGVGILCALIPAIMAGTMPAGSTAAFFWPIAGSLVFTVIRFVPELARNTSLTAVFFLVGVWIALVAWPIIDHGSGVSEGRIVALVTFTFVMSCCFIGLGIRATSGPILTRIQSAPAAAGIDILSTLAGALLLGYLFATVG